MRKTRNLTEFGNRERETKAHAVAHQAKVNMGVQGMESKRSSDHRELIHSLSKLVTTTDVKQLYHHTSIIHVALQNNLAPRYLVLLQVTLF
jgi:hypothetical protein